MGKYLIHLGCCFLFGLSLNFAGLQLNDWKAWAVFACAFAMSFTRSWWKNDKEPT